MDDSSSDTLEIIGLGDNPVLVDADLNVTQPGPAGEQDVMAEMRAAVAVDEPAASQQQPQVGEEDKPKEDEALAAPPAPKPEDEKTTAKSTGEEGDDEKEANDQAPDAAKSDEDKPSEDGSEEKDPKDPEATDKAGTEQPKTAAEPSEADKLADELGGIEVMKAAQPFIESVYDPDLPVSERVSRLEAFVPEAQMKEMRNEVFWQAAEAPDIQEVLTADPEAREIFAQRVFDVPFGYLEKIFNEDKTFLSEEEFKAAVAEYVETSRQEEPKEEVKEPAKTSATINPRTEAKTQDDKKEPPKIEEKKAESTELTPAFTTILNNLSTDVDEIFSTAQFQPGEKDDAETTRLKTEAAKQFEAEWPKAFMADEAAMKAYQTVKGLADQGAEKQAREKYPSLSNHARRVAAQLLQKVSEPLTAHRKATQERAKKAAAASTDTRAATKEKPFSAPAKALTPATAAVDISSLRSDADITRAMEESIERNSRKS